jgi:hypothetical protein
MVTARYTGPNDLDEIVIEMFARPAVLPTRVNEGWPKSSQIVIRALTPERLAIEGVPLSLFTDRGLFLEPSGATSRVARGVSDSSGIASFGFIADESKVPGVVPGNANVLLLAGAPERPVGNSSIQITLIGPPASITIAASPATVAPGEIVTVTVAVKDAVGQDVFDGTVVRFHATPEAKLTNSEAMTIRGTCTTFLLTSNARDGLYSIIADAEGLKAQATVVATRPAW